MTDTTEKGLEALITLYLRDGNGFEEREHKDYDRANCVDAELLFRFLERTQPKEIEKLRKAHGENLRSRVFYRIEEKIKQSTVVNGRVLGGIINLLREGVTDGNTAVKLKLFYDKPASTINELDAANYANNIFSVMRQVRFSPNNEKSLDLALFVNGLPIITFELKNELTKQTVIDAIRQYKNDRDPKEELFRLARCMVHFAVDTDQVWMCTHLKGQQSYFLPFNKGHENGAGNPPNPSGIKTDYLWKEILTKDSITNIIQNYAQLIEEESEKVGANGTIRKVPVKKFIFPRYHQLNVVRRLLSDAKEKGTGQKYLIQHSAGSGKSNSISWLAHQLVGLFGEGTKPIFDSVIVVTDRKILDSQIQANVRQFQQVEGVVEAITEGSKQLKEALEEGKKIIITTIQKFPYIVDEIGELPGTNFAIIIDEAHSSQSGNTAGKLNATLAAEYEKVKVDDDEYIFVDDDMTDEITSEDAIVALVKAKKMLDNASYFAFTATPKNKTLELFGEKYIVEGKEKSKAFDLYSMKQAIDEGFILDVLQNYTTYQSSYSLQKTIEEDPQFDKIKAQKKLKVYVESHPHPIAQKTAVMIDHFMNSVVAAKKIKGLGKAMVVSSSRKNAVQYKRAFDKYLAEIGNPFKAIVAFSGSVGDDTEQSMNGFPSARIADEFKKYENRFLIVANKFQTGFDQPLLHTMYVDKKLGGVSAVQTLSRLNRTTAGKEDTFVLDFANTTDEITKSFSPYFEATILSESTDPGKLFTLQSTLDAFQVYSKEEVHEFSQKILESVPVDQLHAILDAAVQRYNTLEKEEDRDSFRLKCKSFVRLYAFLAQIVPFVDPYLERLFIFLSHLQNKLGIVTGEDLAKGILDSIDMESYRLKKQGDFNIELGQGDELNPIPTEMRGGAADPDIEALSKIVEAFNEKFGTEFTNEDKVRKMTQDLMDDVMADESAVQNINASIQQKNLQNARIAFTEVLKDKMINHIDSNFEVFKEYNDNKEFRDFLAGTLFELMKTSLKKAEPRR